MTVFQQRHIVCCVPQVRVGSGELKLCPRYAPGYSHSGWVSIPIQLYTAIKDQRIAFNLLHAKCGSRIQNRYYCPVCNLTVERGDLVRGYEFAKGQYVQLTESELESLETESSNNIELKEFIPLSKIDPVYFESAYYLGAGEGGEKPYRLLADALAKINRAAIAQLVTRGKEQLVLIRPHQAGLIMHGLFYANEVRNFGEIAKAENVKLSNQEIELGATLIKKMLLTDEARRLIVHGVFEVRRRQVLLLRSALFTELQ
jgi:DNA end-binding protein Ku